MCWRGLGEGELTWMDRVAEGNEIARQSEPNANVALMLLLWVKCAY